MIGWNALQLVILAVLALQAWMFFSTQKIPLAWAMTATAAVLVWSTTLS